MRRRRDCAVPVYVATVVIDRGDGTTVDTNASLAMLEVPPRRKPQTRGLGCSSLILESLHARGCSGRVTFRLWRPAVAATALNCSSTERVLRRLDACGPNPRARSTAQQRARVQSDFPGHINRGQDERGI